MKTLRYILTILLPLIIFIFITVNVINQNTSDLDSFVYKWISRFISSGLTDILKLITFFGSGVLLGSLAFLLLIVFYRKEKYSFNVSMLTINLALGALVNLSIKYIIQRVRPDVLRLIDISGYSFPSGHSMASMSFYGFIIYLSCKNFKTKWKYLIVSLISILILFIGISRIYLGVHYASDVLGGFSLGLLWIGIFSFIVDIRYRKKYRYEVDKK